MRLDPGVAERDVGSLGHHVVAPVACGILQETRAPVAVSEMPPVPFRGRTVVKIEVRAVPVRRTALVLDAVIDSLDSRDFGAELPGEAFDHRGALHMAA